MFPNKRQRQSPRKRLDLGTALEKDRSVSEGKKAKRQLFQSRRSESGPSTSSQNTVIDQSSFFSYPGPLPPQKLSKFFYSDELFEILIGGFHVT